MVFVEIRNRAAVTDNVTLKSPLFSQNILQKCLASAAGLAICPVIGAHHGFYLRFLHTCLECRQIGFIQILLRYDCVELMSNALRSGMHRKMLRARRSL